MKKKILIATLLAAVACGVAYCSTTESSNSTSKSGINLGGKTNNSIESDPLSTIQWIQKYPQLAKIESNSQTAVIDKLRTSESISALIGPIDNPYGVRNDILDAIIQAVPESNPKLLQASIQTAFFYNLASYSVSDTDKLKYVRKGNLAMHCIFMAVNNRNNANDIVDIISHKLRDNKNRSSYQNNLDLTVFAWQTLGSGYGANTEDDMCNTGEYLK